MTDEKQLKIATLLLDIFGGNPYHAKFVPENNPNGRRINYMPVQAPLSSDLLLEHLNGETTLGSYVVLAGSNMCKYVCWDVDVNGNLEKAREVADRIIARINHLPYAVEFSGNKGYHIFLFFNEPIPARKAKEIGEYIRDTEGLAKSGDEHVEVFPKQDILEKHNDGSRKPLGSLLKLPLGKHPSTHNWSVFVNDGNAYENGIVLDAEVVLSQRIALEDFIALKEGGKGSVEELAKAIASEWDAGKRHEICLYLAGYLSQIGWSFEKTLDLVDKVLSIRVDDSAEGDDRRQAVKDTYIKVSRGIAVAGFQALSQVISGALMKNITTEAPLLAAPPIARQIDNVRFGKGAMWVKERDASNLIWGWLTDKEEVGRIIKVDTSGTGSDWKTYWFSKKTRITVALDSSSFDRVLFDNFHLSIGEEFVKHIKTQLILRANAQGEEVEIYKRSFYRNGKLYINLGNTTIYVLDGENPPQEIMNGDENIFFITNNPKAIKADYLHPKDIWEELIDPINFDTNDEITMKPDEQKELLKAWVLSFFFRNNLPTRPILTILGEAGSGKTTAIRQILRVLEGITEDVTSITDDKQDAWRTMLEHKSFIVLDNMEESRAKWVARALDLVATGNVIELRQLYTTNDTYTIRPDVFVAITAVNMPFTKETVFQRMLVLNTKKLEKHIGANLIEKRLQKYLPNYWGDLLLKLNEAVRVYTKIEAPTQAVDLRMADFALFCKHMEHCSFMEDNVIERGLRHLVSSQQSALATSEFSAYPLFMEWIEKNRAESLKPKKAGEWRELLQELAKKVNRQFFWTTPASFARHITAIKQPLVDGLKMVETSNTDPIKGKEFLTYHFDLYRDEIEEEEREAEETGVTTFDLSRGG